MDGNRVKALARMLLADVLAVGSAVTAGPVLTPEQEARILDALEARVRDLLADHYHDSDEDVAARFRKEHPELFTGSLQDRDRAVRRHPK